MRFSHAGLNPASCEIFLAIFIYIWYHKIVVETTSIRSIVDPNDPASFQRQMMKLFFFGLFSRIFFEFAVSWERVSAKRTLSQFCATLRNHSLWLKLQHNLLLKYPKWNWATVCYGFSQLYSTTKKKQRLHTLNALFLVDLVS